MQPCKPVIVGLGQSEWGWVGGGVAGGDSQHTGRAPGALRGLDLNPLVTGGPGSTLQPGDGDLLRVNSGKVAWAGQWGPLGGQSTGCRLRGSLLLHCPLWSLP